MFGNHFYHATLRKSVAVFGTLFNNISVVRKDGSGGILSQQKVPLAYGPKQKFLSRLDQSTNIDASVALKLPRMAFEITGITLDTTQKLNKRNQVVFEILSEETGQPVEKVEEKLKHDFYMTSREAITYGLVQELI